MQNLGNLIDKLIKVRDELPKEAERIAIAMASSHKAIVVQRLQAEGIPGEKYSERGVPAYFYTGFSSIEGKNKGKTYQNDYARQNSGFDRMIKQKQKSGELVSWKDVRESNGLQTNHVDFTFSGMTFKNLNVVSVETNGYTARAFIGNTTAEGAHSMLMGYKMYGDFMAPNEKEKDLLTNVASEMINGLFKKFNI